MKHINITDKVMKKVARYEKHRIYSWKRIFFVTVGLLCFFLGATVMFVTRVLAERQVFDLLTVFGEDWEIIAEFWQDTVVTIIDELPLIEVGIVIFVLLLISAIIISTRKKRRILSTKEKELIQYK